MFLLWTALIGLLLLIIVSFFDGCYKMVNTPYEKDTDLSHTLHGQPPKAALGPWLP